MPGATGVVGKEGIRGFPGRDGTPGADGEPGIPVWEMCITVIHYMLCMTLMPAILVGQSRRSRPKRTTGAIGGDCK